MCPNRGRDVHEVTSGCRLRASRFGAQESRALRTRRGASARCCRHLCASSATAGPWRRTRILVRSSVWRTALSNQLCELPRCRGRGGRRAHGSSTLVAEHAAAGAHLPGDHDGFDGGPCHVDGRQAEARPDRVRRAPAVSRHRGNRYREDDQPLPVQSAARRSLDDASVEWLGRQQQRALPDGGGRRSRGS